MTGFNRRTLLGALFASAATPAFPHGEHQVDLDEQMFERENYFQIIDQPKAPAFELEDIDGNTVRLSDFSDKVVVLSFIYASCPDVCPLQTQKIATIQEMINALPIKDRVQFISITSDPENDTGQVLRDYAGQRGLDLSNWTFLTKRPGQSNDITRILAEAYNHKFEVLEDGYQAHGTVTHIIDRGGRFAAKFHGMKYENDNLVQYVSGLIDGIPDAKWWNIFNQ